VNERGGSVGCRHLAAAIVARTFALIALLGDSDRSFDWPLSCS
jgi:hypothetical protein